MKGLNWIWHHSFPCDFNFKRGLKACRWIVTHYSVWRFAFRRTRNSKKQNQRYISNTRNIAIRTINLVIVALAVWLARYLTSCHTSPMYSGLWSLYCALYPGHERTSEYSISWPSPHSWHQMTCTPANCITLPVIFRQIITEIMHCGLTSDCIWFDLKPVNSVCREREKKDRLTIGMGQQ